MLQSILSSFLGCSHQRATFPLTSGRQSGASRTYIACLDCGKEFAYNWQEMRVGAPVSMLAPAGEVQSPVLPEGARRDHLVRARLGLRLDVLHDRREIGRIQTARLVDQRVEGVRRVGPECQ